MGRENHVEIYTQIGDAHNTVLLKCAVIFNLFLIPQYLHKWEKHLLL